MTAQSNNSAALRRRARILLLLDAAREAGLAPIGVMTLHGFAYLSNVLAPVWDMPSLEGSILKRKGGAFYPELQHEVDRLVGLGMVIISGLSHSLDGTGRWRLEGRYELNAALSSPTLETLHALPGEGRVASFVLELGYALSALSNEELAAAFIEDATYSDPAVSNENVLDFAEWRDSNPTANVIAYFGKVSASRPQSSPGERLHSYVRQLRRRLHAA